MSDSEKWLDDFSAHRPTLWISKAVVEAGRGRLLENTNAGSQRKRILDALDEMEGSASQSANEPDLVGASESATHEASPRCSREDEPEWCETGPAGENPQGAALLEDDSLGPFLEPSGHARD